jgi:hypothetical protein
VPEPISLKLSNIHRTMAASSGAKDSDRRAWHAATS